MLSTVYYYRKGEDLVRCMEKQIEEMQKDTLIMGVFKPMLSCSLLYREAFFSSICQNWSGCMLSSVGIYSAKASKASAYRDLLSSISKGIRPSFFVTGKYL